jgi:hypothetical protein
MKHQQFVLRSIVQSVLLLFCISVFCGCSIIGFSVGAAIDGSKPDKDILYVDAAFNLRPDDEVRISLVDSTVIEGTYKQLEALDSSVYASRYARFVQSASPNITFPRLGDTLLLTTKADTARQWVYLFRGFGAGILNLQRLDHFQIGKIAFGHLSALEIRGGVRIDLGMLERMSNAGRLPRDISLVVQNKRHTLSVAFDDIKFVEKSNSKNAKWIGLGVGFALDAIIITASLISLSHSMSHIGSGLKFN